METQTASERHVEWHLAPQRFSGTPQEVARELDHLILALVALRRTLGAGALGLPERRAAPGFWPRLRTVLGLAWFSSRPRAAESFRPAFTSPAALEVGPGASRIHE